jgi:hypothetical protein
MEGAPASEVRSRGGYEDGLYVMLDTNFGEFLFHELG